MEQQRWVKTNAAKVTGALQGAASVPEFGERLLSNLVPMMGGGVAGLFVLETDKQILRRVAGYGLPGHAEAADVVPVGVGLAGRCAAERTHLALSGLPPEYPKVTSGLGGAPPLYAGAWPLKTDDSLLGVLEFASFGALGARERSLLDEMLPVVAMSLEILTRSIATQELLAQTQEQAHQLELQSEVTKMRARLDAMHAGISAELMQTGDFESTLRRCAEVIQEGAGTVFTRIWMLDAETDTLVLATSVGLHTNRDGKRARVKVGEMKLGRIAAMRQALETNSILTQEGVDEDWAKSQGIVSLGGYPLVVKDRLVGVMITFGRHERSGMEFKALGEAGNRYGMGNERTESGGGPTGWSVVSASPRRSAVSRCTAAKVPIRVPTSITSEPAPWPCSGCSCRRRATRSSSCPRGRPIGTPTSNCT